MTIPKHIILDPAPGGSSTPNAIAQLVFLEPGFHDVALEKLPDGDYSAWRGSKNMGWTTNFEVRHLSYQHGTDSYEHFFSGRFRTKQEANEHFPTGKQLQVPGLPGSHSAMLFYLQAGLPSPSGQLRIVLSWSGPPH